MVELVCWGFFREGLSCIVYSAPGAVSSLMALPKFTSIVLTWMPPQEPNGIISAYEVTYRVGDEADLVNTTVEASTTTFTILLARRNRVSGITVTARNDMGRGEAAGLPDTTSLREGKLTL